MGEGKIETDVAAKQIELRPIEKQLLDFINDERKNSRSQAPEFSNKRDAGTFLDFRNAFDKLDREGEFSLQAEQIKNLLDRRSAAEALLQPQQKDELRRARRDYMAANTFADKSQCKKEIERLVPGSAELNLKLRTEIIKLNGISTLTQRSDPQECMRCHPHQKTYFDPLDLARGSISQNFDNFFKPKKEDQFEARWAQIALDSPLVKANEAMKQLPHMKITAEDPVKLVKMALTVAGVDMNVQTSSLVEKAIGGVQGIAKKSGNRFEIDRNGAVVEVPFPQKQPLAAGIELRGLELGDIGFTLSENKYPEIREIKGLKVKLDVPCALSAIGRIDSEAEIKRIYLERKQSTGDFEVKVEVVNPVPWAVRKLAAKMFNGVPEDETITVPIATLAPDGRPR